MPESGPRRVDGQVLVRGENRQELGVDVLGLPQGESETARDWLLWKTPSLSSRTVKMHEINLSHINGAMGGLLITDISPEDISEYQKSRLAERASPKTVNLEIATVRAILRRNKLWATIADDVRMLPVRTDKGRALSQAEEDRLLEACAKSRSRVLYPFAVLALNTGLLRPRVFLDT